MVTPICRNPGYVASIVTSFLEIPGMICSSIYFSGCPFRCKGCQNTELQELSCGTKSSVDDIIQKINSNQLAKWACFLGGEPFFQPDFLFNLCSNISKPIGIYTGFTFDTINTKFHHIISLPNVKFLKTGCYDEALLKSDEFPITTNQEVYLKYPPVLQNEPNVWAKCPHRAIPLISIDVKKTIA